MASIPQKRISWNTSKADLGNPNYYIKQGRATIIGGFAGFGLEYLFYRFSPEYSVVLGTLLKVAACFAILFGIYLIIFRNFAAKLNKRRFL
jgi:hypothetical protein